MGIFALWERTRRGLERHITIVEPLAHSTFGGWTMFERFLRDPHALARHRNGPLADERCRYLAHCAAERVSYETLRGTANYLLIIANALHLTERPNGLITQREIDAAARHWVHRPRKQAK